MNHINKSHLTTGVILVLVGAIFLALEVVPNLRAMVQQWYDWPMIIVAVGAVIFVSGLIMQNPESASSGTFIAGLGGLLYWQNATGNWGSWAWAWALLPGFAAVGELLTPLFGARDGKAVKRGINGVVVSAILFLIFGSFLGGFDLLGPYWPLLLVAAGVLVLVNGLLNRSGS
jgi:cytochrome bd-type quinol oxidase subunit 2